MKKLCCIFGILFVSFGAFAQADIHTTSLNGGTNNVAATHTNTVAIPITVVRGSSVSIQPSFQLTGSGTTACVFSLDQSVDNVTWQKNAIRISVTPSGTTPVTIVSSQTTGATCYLRIGAIENPNSSAMTNIVVKYSIKDGI